MEKSTFALETPLREQLDRLAAFEPVDAPVISLYLDLRANAEGREQAQPFLRKALPERARSLKGDARKAFDRDVERITAYLDGEVRPSANGVALFACSAANGFFEAIQLDAAIEGHWLFIGSVPHLYPLARVNDEYPRYAALLTDTNSARIFVFGLAATESTQQVRNQKTKRVSMGGWSQARYQRHVSNFHLHHIKEVVETLDKVVRAEAIDRVIVSCDEVTKPILMEQLPKHLLEKLVDMVRLDTKAPEREVLQQTLEALRAKDADTDAERVSTMLDGWRAGGLGVVGPEATLMALTMGQVEELMITATPGLLRKAETVPADMLAPGPVDVETSTPGADVDPDRLKLADELVTKAQQSSARIRFIEDPDLLADVGGVGAILRFKL